MSKRLLVQTQLSNILPNGKFDLACDSGWQMTIGRVREMLRLNPELQVDVMGPYEDYDGQAQLVSPPGEINPDVFRNGRCSYLEHWIVPNALETRFDFDYENISYQLKRAGGGEYPRYDAVLINDPMHLRNFKAMFRTRLGYVPRFYVHSHFVDLPSKPKFPQEASLWYGQCEAALRADHNFWQCDSTLREFLREFGRHFKHELVEDVARKSSSCDDGYSIAEITAPVDFTKMRFSAKEWYQKTQGKVVLFFPNRISPSSDDYTNGMRFMFDLLPKLRERRQDFVVVCGNPNLKFSNEELERSCGRDGYVRLTSGTLNRDEYKFVASHSDVVLGLYGNDAYGGTASRECIELGCLPIWLDVNEYRSISYEIFWRTLVNPDFTNFVQVASDVITLFNPVLEDELLNWKRDFRSIVRRRCSYESTVPEMMRVMDLR